MNTTIAVLKWVYIDEANSSGRCLQHRFDCVFAHTCIGIKQPADKVAEIGGSRTDEFRQRIVPMIPLA